MSTEDTGMAPQFSNPEDRKKIKGCLQEMVDAMTRKAAESDKYNYVRARLKEDFGISSRLANRLAKAMYNDSIERERAEFENFDLLYEQITAAPTNTPVAHQPV